MSIITLTDTKKFYWIKLKTDFFNRAEIDFLLSQPNGFQYIVLYLLLCVSTANTDGKLMMEMNELIVPYDVEKIVRDTKYFDFDTVAVALDLYKKLGLVYEEEDNILRITNFNELVGGETKWAEKKRLYREKKKKLKVGQREDIVREEIEYRDKSIEYRDIDIDNKSIDNNIHTYSCHLNKNEKDAFCLECNKKSVCNKKTSEIFLKMYGKTFEEYMNSKNENNDKIILTDYDWLNDESEDDNY